MNYKITCHLMPWELDYALLSFTQLKKSKYYLNSEDNIYIDVTLNLSNHIIDWDKSKISKQFFINKFKYLQPLLIDYICNFKIYEGDELYGGLDSQRESTEDHIDHYMILNPDMYFNEKVLYYLVESSKLITNKYFTITQQITKLWDSSWDVIVNRNYIDVPYSEYKELDTFDVRFYGKYQTEGTELISIDTPKWEGWLDLYNKNMWVDFWTYHKEWKGYGSCDWYCILLSQYAKSVNIDFQQYALKNNITCEYAIGPLKEGGFSKYYKDMLVLKDIPNQKDQFISKMGEYLNKGIQHLNEKNTI